MNIQSEDLKIAFADEGIMLLKSDNICLGGKIPLPGGVIGIVVDEMELFPKGATDRQGGHENNQMVYNRGHADHSREPANRSADRGERGGMDMGAKICPYCGAYLDPDEKCDCRDEDIATSQNEKDPDADQSKSESQ